MSGNANHATSFDRSVYNRAQGDFEALHDSMPDAAVRQLAREVVSRMAARIHVKKHESYLPTNSDLDMLCEALISKDKDAGSRIIEQVRRDGVPVDVLYLTHLSSAARRLGEWWDADRTSFTDVTIGVSRIYAIMLGLRTVFAANVPVRHKAAVFASVPGETHTLGVTMAAELFRQKGWDVDLKVSRSHEELVDEIAGTDTSLIGLSGGCERSRLPLVRLIVALRITSPHALIMVSGQIAEQHRDIVSIAGADASASDYDTAVAEMERLASLVRPGLQAAH